MYKYFSYRDYNYGIIRLFNDALHECVLSQRNYNGIRMHVCDVVLDELLNVDCMEEIRGKKVETLTEEGFLNVLEPFLALCAVEPDDIVRRRARENIFEKFIFHCNLKESEKTFEKVNVPSVSSYIFEIAKGEGVNRKRRNELKNLGKLYTKTIKKAKKSKKDDVEMTKKKKGEEEDMKEPLKKTKSQNGKKSQGSENNIPQDKNSTDKENQIIASDSKKEEKKTDSHQTSEKRKSKKKKKRHSDAS